MRIYLIDDRQIDYQEVPVTPQKWTDRMFIDFAEQQGSVYSFEGFQNQWHNGELFELDLEQSWIRII